MNYPVYAQVEGTAVMVEGEVEAASTEDALEQATRWLLRAYFDVPSRAPGKMERILITVMDTPGQIGQTWRITLKEPVPTPCGQCGGYGGVDSGGVGPQGEPIMIQCPSCHPQLDDDDLSTIREVAQTNYDSSGSAAVTTTAG